MEISLNANAVAFIGLCREFCITVENAREAVRSEFINGMIRLLPRIYITANDLPDNLLPDDGTYYDSVLDPDYAEALRRNIETLMGSDDVYLDVQEEDMKYSDTPVAESVSEGLVNIFSPFYSFIQTIPDATEETVRQALYELKEHFATYLSDVILNVLRALNRVRMGADGFIDDPDGGIY
ncbi:MAG: DUF5063 domain-containing protein [Muribaculaceae bacterium]|nr:DUF5063 domain-containing protein [Muribaculaceae bacterium]MDE6629286.1 DUF5063 domain-containing protein [Muribaculaceae bacterium]